MLQPNWTTWKTLALSRALLVHCAYRGTSNLLAKVNWLIDLADCKAAYRCYRNRATPVSPLPLP